VLGSSLATAQPAAGKELGKAMDLVFSADRLFGLHFGHAYVDNRTPGPFRGGEEVDENYTTIGFGWPGQAVGQAAGTPFTMARFAFDIFVIDSLSVGGAIGYTHVDIHHEETPVGAPVNGVYDTDWASGIFAPRVGYIWNLGSVVSFWLRGGITYHWASYGNAAGCGGPGPCDLSQDGWAFTIEPTFTFSPIEHFAFVGMPYLDIDFTGKTRVPGTFDRTTHYRSFGIAVGLLGWI
jgi:hypothetical protein